MGCQFIKQKHKILIAPLEPLHLTQRYFLKSLLLATDHMIHIENSATLSETPDPLIFAMNHNTSYESVLAPARLIFERQGRKISFVSDWMYGHYPVLSWIWRQMDPVYVYNKPSSLKSLNRFRLPDRTNTVYDECIQRLSGGGSIGIFPEGTRNSNPLSLLKGRHGIGLIALTSGVPVLPTGIDFPSRIQNGKIPRFGPMILRVGSIMQFPDEYAMFQHINSLSEVDPLARKKIVKYLAAKVTYKIMTELAKLSGKDYPFQPPLPPKEWERLSYQNKEAS